MHGALMVQGTTSDAGKSTLVAALCRILSNKKCAVAPFKPQNMALNSAVTPEGGEIGRAQALQAQASRVTPSIHMNPVLLKPASDIGAQIIVQGKALGNMNAETYHQYKPVAKKAVFDSFHQLHSQYSAIIVEGAGSPAEINLREGDIANMGFAEEVDCPVILIADIDRGGVFAHLVGTIELLSESEKKRIQGFVINKFRGDIALLKPGLDWLEEKTGKPVLGVLPYFKDFFLDAEDAIDTRQLQHETKDKLKVVVPVLPRISNHTDFDPLRIHPCVELNYVSVTDSPPPCDLIILPGSKNVREDLESLIQNRWRDHLQKHLRYSGKLIGICGGLQMLGERILDPNAIESASGVSQAFSLLPIETTMAANKTLTQKAGLLSLGTKEKVKISGYEIHHGQTRALNFLKTSIEFNDQQTEGFLSDDNLIFGSYLHGLFDEPQACKALLQWAGLNSTESVDINAQRDQQIERLARETEKHLDVAKIFDFLQLSPDDIK